jgi:predicted  nucleic acid-binding Zn-ribbon protein
MNEIVGLLESELEAAFEVKDKESLHRYVVLMVDRFAARASEEERHSRLERKMDEGFAEIKEDVRSIAATMQEGFARFDERFEAVDRRFEEQNEKFEARFAAVDKRFEDMNQRFEDMNKRFDDMNKRFNSLTVLMSVFFTVLAGMMTALGLFG